ISPLEGNLFEKSRFLRRFIEENLAPDEILHFTMYFPLLLRARNPIVFTDPVSNSDYYNFREKIAVYTRMLLADRVDMLDPSRGRRLQKKIFWKPEKVSITSNTFVDLEKYKALEWSEKKDWLVFLGRFEPIKQVVEYVRSIPAINKTMRELGIKKCNFFLLGHGTLESELRNILEQPEFNEIDVQIRYEPQPNEILARAKIFFSLQKFTNFPSKSLAEALASGCLPIVTDNGATRKMAKPAFSFYVLENFSAETLAAKVREIYELSEEERQKKSNLAREFAASELSIEKMTDYYLDLYAQLFLTKNQVKNFTE
ncbi:MAG TPA: glycosyltransferase, partial [Pyrinomonadaceae bacterium]|nr:glycosyltransferase [Pyrinomonadaceae bacterium]